MKRAGGRLVRAPRLSLSCLLPSPVLFHLDCAGTTSDVIRAAMAQKLSKQTSQRSLHSPSSSLSSSTSGHGTSSCTPLTRPSLKLHYSRGTRAGSRLPVCAPLQRALPCTHSCTPRRCFIKSTWACLRGRMLYGCCLSISQGRLLL